MAKNQQKQDLQRVIALRVTNREYALLKEEAKIKDQKMSEYCRKILMKNNDNQN